MNELEERRVIRLLGDVADAVEPLTAEEVEVLLQPAALRRVPRRRRRVLRVRALGAIAAAAAVVLGTTVLTRSSPPQAQGRTPAQAQLSFTEGSALRLLLAPRTS